jgi:hypothetical protein
MAASDDLSEFVKQALARDVPRQEIEDALLRAGWHPHQVRTAMSGFAAIEFPVPVPRPRPHLSAREAFMYLVLFSTLYVSAYHLGSLAFRIIERAFPDAAASDFAYGTDYWRRSVRWSVSSLVVAFPIFLYMSWLVTRTMQQDPSKGVSAVRRWLTYLTLFVAAGVLIGDVITLVYNFLGGELTVRFVLKVLTVGAIAGSIFWHYLSELWTKEASAGP